MEKHRVKMQISVPVDIITVNGQVKDYFLDSFGLLESTTRRLKTHKQLVMKSLQGRINKNMGKQA